MNESLNDILNESDEDEQDLIVDKILDEIGIEVSGKVRRIVYLFYKNLMSDCSTRKFFHLS